MDSILLLLCQFCRYPDAETQAWALQAVGQLCVRYPSYLLRTTAVMEAALAPSAAPKSKIQILRTFTDLLQQDELRMQALASQGGAPTAVVRIDKYGLSSTQAIFLSLSLSLPVFSLSLPLSCSHLCCFSLSGGIMQRYFDRIRALLLDQEIGVRAHAVTTVGHIIRYGLVNPLEVLTLTPRFALRREYAKEIVRERERESEIESERVRE